ncbi:hypothetical protein [Streptomyces sp. NPDC050145]|uniref:hypothetical protein n=1 Tax=Streptomyces sp. NPDC050145 TaxID=3365602 RepID=UPI00379EBD8D
MARMFVDGDDVVVHLSWRERAAARRGDVRAPLSSVSRVTVEPSWWRPLRGVPGKGRWTAGTRCIGTRAYEGGSDFVAIRHGRPVVCVEFRDPAPFRLLATSVATLAEARDRARAIGGRAPDLDTSTPCRQPLPVPEEHEENTALDPRRSDSE